MSGIISVIDIMSDEKIQIWKLTIELCLVPFYLDPCARVNCNHGRCEVDRNTAVCRCYPGYTGHDCLTPTGKILVHEKWFAVYVVLVVV